MKMSTLTSSQDFITADGVEGSAASVVPQGSILVVARSGILAHTLPVAIAGRPLAFNQDIKAIQVTSDKVLSEFVYWFLRGKEPEVLSRGVKKRCNGA
jgi:type I restriction enzyme S subunit